MSHYNTIPNHIILLDVKKKFEEIKTDLINNQRDVVNRYNYYTTKYKGNRLNDVNVGLYLDDKQRIVAQIFVRNSIGYIKELLIFNKEGREIVSVETLNYNV